MIYFWINIYLVGMIATYITANIFIKVEQKKIVSRVLTRTWFILPAMIWPLFLILFVAVVIYECLPVKKDWFDMSDEKCEPFGYDAIYQDEIDQKDARIIELEKENEKLKEELRQEINYLGEYQYKNMEEENKKLRKDNKVLKKAMSVRKELVGIAMTIPYSADELILALQSVCDYSISSMTSPQESLSMIIKLQENIK